MIIEEIEGRDDLFHLNLTEEDLCILARCVDYVRLHSVFPYKVESDLDFLSRAFADSLSRLY